MFVTPAFAQAGAGGTNEMLMSLVPFALIFVIMYFLILRPQQKRMKAQREMISNLRRGDQVLTNGGLFGKISKVIDDNEIELEIAQGVKVRLARSFVAEVRSKSEVPANDSSAS